MTELATVNTFVVNYTGRPFMEDLRENKLMVRALQITLGYCLRVFPPMNDLMQLAPLPVDGDFMQNIASNSGLGSHIDVLLSSSSIAGFKTTRCSLMLADTFLAVAMEKIVIKMFAPKK
eukprot:CAMPEP_0204652260 /NCGR_PEP_ID=MMETSP0718-20130828/14448_1 /ASSEMBLY_ACC=CAM_ASM_000674 /TAXON_ID=230516 /ORGANISM="Chaetoceros curvisetus" /LENGTH=118 /DNA_ID=CAMNT_0051676193 /DNA_START=1038 /DNA_END=1395 /DNA_ORIENTATION=-